MKNFSVLFLLFFVFNTTAQVDNLLNDDKVIWVGESSNDYLFDIQNNNVIELKDLDGPLISFEILKLQEIKGKYWSDGYYHFAKILLDAIYNNEINIYSDSTCTLLANKSVLYITDTICSQFDTTFYPKPKVINYELHPEEFKLFRVYQRLYYKPEKGIWEIRALSFAPLRLFNDSIEKPLFWIKCNFQKPPLDKNTAWKVRTHYHSIDFEKMKVIKNKVSEPPLSNFLKVCIDNQGIIIYNAQQSWKSPEVENKKDLKDRLFSTDTINEINPINYETKTKLITRKVDLNKLKKLTLNQEWSWDEKQKNLSVRLIGVALSLPEYDIQGNLFYYKSLFYRLFDE